MPQEFPLKIVPPPAKDGFDFSALALRVSRLADHANPTIAEKNNLWRIACETIAEHARAGRHGPAVKASLAGWLIQFAPALAASESAMLRNLERKLARHANGESVADLRKQAAKARRAPKLGQSDRDALVTCAVFQNDGNLDPAWWQCVAAGKLSAEIIARYPLSNFKRPRCPKSIRRQVAKEIACLLKQHRSERQAKLNGAYMTRDWENVFAGDWFSSDDITLPVYYYIPDGNGWFELTRGQFLPLIDVRSKRILDFVLIDGKTYNAAAIRSLINRVGMRWGLPRKGFHFERGIWKDAKLLGGGSALPWEEVEQTFADRLGLCIHHSLPGNARAKIVENVAGLFQNLLAGEPGYVGRNEMVVKYDRIQKAKLAVEAKRQHPAEAGFLSGEQQFARLHELCAQYNAKPQQSDVFGGYMSPDEAWERFQLRDSAGAVDGLVKLPLELRYLLASQRELVTVRRGRIRVPFSKLQYTVGGANLYDGENLIAWYDPDAPESLIVTDLKKENVTCLPREITAPAYGATPDEYKEASAAVREQNRRDRARYSELAANYMPPTRANVTDPASLEIGRRMESTKLEIKTREGMIPHAVEYRTPQPQAPQMSLDDRQRRKAELEELERAHQGLFE